MGSRGESCIREEKKALVSHALCNVLSLSHLQGTWSCSSTQSKTKFDEVEFDGGEWTDYDETGSVPVSIMELEGRWVKA